MKKFITLLVFMSLLLCVSAPVQAYQYSESYASVSGLSITSDSRFFSVYYGFYSSSYALTTNSEGEFDADAFFSASLNSWADAEITSASASSGTWRGAQESQAQASAGGAFGESSYAMAGTYAGAYGIYLTQAATLTFSIDYYLSADIYGDGPGYAEAGAGALLGLYFSGFNDSQSEWLELAGSFGSDEQSGTLMITAELLPYTVYKLFSGTAVYALASSPAPVPEPATMLLLGIGMIGIAGVSRRKKFTRNPK